MKYSIEVRSEAGGILFKNYELIGDEHHNIDWNEVVNSMIERLNNKDNKF